MPFAAKRCGLIVLGCLLGVTRAGAQVVQVVPDPGAAETQYRDAEEAWIKADPNLEADLYRVRPDEMRKRIRRVAILRDDAMVKKTSFLDFMVKRMDDVQKRMNAEASLAIPTQDFRKDLEEEQTRLREEQDRVKARLQELPKGQEYAQIKDTIEAEQADLLSLRSTVEQRVHALDELSKAQETAAGLTQDENLSARIGELRGIWEGERDRSERSRKTWARYYSELEKSLGKSGPSKHSSTP